MHEHARPLLYLVKDTENSGAQRNKAHPFDERNRCIALQLNLYRLDTHEKVDEFVLYNKRGIEEANPDYTRADWSRIRSTVQSFYDRAEVVVGFNLKYDLHWIRRVFGVRPKRVFCAQVAEFILGYQLDAYPSLHRTATLHYGLEGKLDIVSKEYWDKGYDTDDVPKSILLEYLDVDVVQTSEVFKKQLSRIKLEGMSNLIQASMQDLVVLADMEWNGQLYNKEKSKKLAELTKLELEKLRNELVDITSAKHPDFNWGSPVQLRALLYGGSVVYNRRVPIGVYKSGAKLGQTRYKIEQDIVEFPQLFTPPKVREGQNPGTGADVILSLKAKNKVSQRVKDLLIKYAETDQQLSLYYIGLPNKIDEQGWSDNIVHGQLNQVVAVTGRLSATSPNMQNVNKTTKKLFISRFSMRKTK